MEKIITIQEVVWPAQGKKQGRLIDVNGDAWFVYPDKLGSLKPGMTIKATDITVSNFQGKTYHTLKAFEIQGGASQGVGQAPAPNRVPSPPQTQSIDNDRRLDIFVCGAMNAILSNPTVDPSRLTVDHYAALVNRLRVTWTRTLGPTAPQIPPARGESDAEMNDDIPF